MLPYVKRVRDRFFIVMLSILMIGGLAVSYYNYQIIVSEEKNTLAIEHDNIHRSYDFVLKQLENDLLLHSEIILGSKELRKAIASQERSKILELAQSSFELLKKDNPYLKIMTFRLPDGRTLLRLHRPKMFGDSLHPSRKMIIQTNEKQTAHTGFEVGKLEMAYRSVAPIFYEDRYIGSLELGVDMDYIIHSLKQVAYLQYALLVKGIENSAALTKPVLPMIGDFYLVKSDPLFTENIDKINLQVHSIEASCCDRLYTITSDLDLGGYKGETVAKILLGFDIHAIAQRTDKVLTRSILFVFIIVGILSLVINAGFKFFTNQLTKTQEELAGLNQTLEQRVNEEIDKNRMQEKHMLHQSRLAQMGETLSMIAHQWRQPLATINAIIASTKLRYELQDFDLDKKNDKEALITYTHDQLDRIENSIISLSEIIDDFKDFYKPTKNKVAIEIHKPIQRALNLIEASFISKHINCEIIYEDRSKVKVHFNELTQVLLNLFQNAMEEMLEHDTPHPTVSVKTFSDERYTYIEICDNGEGIDEKLAEKIFDPYFSTKEEKNGSGLGLYMSKMIIEEHHHGKFYLKKESKQTCFVIALPKSLKA